MGRGTKQQSPLRAADAASAGDAIREILASKGLRPTAPRVSVLAAVFESPAPESANEIHARLARKGSRVGIATVYRTLALLHESGLVGRMLSVSQFVYEPVKSDSASHVVCSRCGKINDVIDPDLERLKEKVFKQSGYAAGNHMVTFYADCRRDECEP